MKDDVLELEISPSDALAMLRKMQNSLGDNIIDLEQIINNLVEDAYYYYSTQTLCDELLHHLRVAQSTISELIVNMLDLIQKAKGE